MKERSRLKLKEMREEEKERKQQERESRNKVRASKKAQKEAVEEQWRRIKEDHEKALAEWQQRYDDLKRKGVKRKDLPDKPPRPRKPVIATELEEVEVLEVSIPFHSTFPFPHDLFPRPSDYPDGDGKAS